VRFLGFFFWKWEEDFHVREHVRAYDYDYDENPQAELRLPQPRTDAELERVLGSLINRPYRRGFSPWEVLLVHPFRSGSEGKEETVILWRFHHSMGDFYGWIHIMLSDCYDFREFKTPAPSRSKSKSPSKLLTALKFPWDLAKVSVDFDEVIRSE
jgi:hypothetical protein